MKTKSAEGKIGERWAKNGEKLPIVRQCRLDLTRSVRRDACSNFCCQDVENPPRGQMQKVAAQLHIGSRRRMEMLRISTSILPTRVKSLNSQKPVIFVTQFSIDSALGAAFGIAIATENNGVVDFAAVDDDTHKHPNRVSIQQRTVNLSVSCP